MLHKIVIFVFLNFAWVSGDVIFYILKIYSSKIHHQSNSLLLIV